MPVNLTQEAKAKWAEAIAARNPETKVRLLRQFYSLMRKHKGTEKLEKSIKRQIASLEDEVKRAANRKTGSTRQLWVVKKEGDLQLVVVGKLQSSTEFFNIATKLHLRQYDPLFRPCVGVMKGLGLTFQLVLAPFDDKIGVDKLERFVALMRNADALIVLTGDDKGYAEKLVQWLEERDLDVLSHIPSAEIEYASSGGLRVVGDSDFLNKTEVHNLLIGYSIRNALVKVWRNTTIDDVENVFLGRTVRKTLFFVSKRYQVDILPKGVKSECVLELPADLDELALLVIDRLDLIRVFTKPIGREPVRKPILMGRGKTIIELAEHIHRDFARRFRFAKIWRKTMSSAVKVGRGFPLEDEDVVELHALW